MHVSVVAVKTLYNLNISERVLPLNKTMKRVAYYAETYGTWPNPQMVRVEDMRREPITDSPVTLFRRLLYAVLTVSTGAEFDPDSGRSDEGAGFINSAGCAPQWCNGNHVIGLLDEVESYRDGLTAFHMTKLYSLLHDTLHKQTLGGRASVSHALHNAVQTCDMFALVLKQRQTQYDGASPSARSPRAEARASPPTPRTTQPTSKCSGGKGSGSGGKIKKSRFEDKAGELGPNGLPRMVLGGNPQGSPCKDHSRGRCPFESCSFSHA